MKAGKGMSSLAARVSGLGLIATTMTAQPLLAIIYQHEYNADAMPQSSTPDWQQALGDGTAGVSGGILTYATSGPFENRAWRIGVNTPHGTPDIWGAGASGWLATTNVGGVVDFRIKITTTDDSKQPFWIEMSDGTNVWDFAWREGGVFQFGGPFIPFDNSTFNTYRIAFQDGKASLYVNSDAVPLLNMVSPNYQTDLNGIWFGDLGSGDYGTVEVDFFRWTNLSTEFAAPVASPVPEPSVLGLVVLGAGILWRRRR